MRYHCGRLRMVTYLWIMQTWRRGVLTMNLGGRERLHISLRKSVDLWNDLTFFSATDWLTCTQSTSIWLMIDEFPKKTVNNYLCVRAVKLSEPEFSSLFFYPFLYSHLWNRCCLWFQISTISKRSSTWLAKCLSVWGWRLRCREWSAPPPLLSHTPKDLQGPKTRNLHHLVQYDVHDTHAPGFMFCFCFVLFFLCRNARRTLVGYPGFNQRKMRHAVYLVSCMALLRERLKPPTFGETSLIRCSTRMAYIVTCRYYRSQLTVVE